MLVQSGTWADEATPSKARHLSIEPNDHAKVVRYVKAQRAASASPGNHKSRPSKRQSGCPSTNVSPGSSAAESGNWVHISSDIGLNVLSNDVSIDPDILPDNSSPKGTDILPTSSQATPQEEVIHDIGREACDVARNSGNPHNDVPMDDCGDFAPETDFQLIMPRDITIPHDSFSFERILKSVEAYAFGCPIAVQHAIAMPSPEQPSSGTTHVIQNSPSLAFASHLKHGVYLQKVSSPELSWSALDKACALAGDVVANPAACDFLLLRELFLTLSPVNIRNCPERRRNVLQHTRVSLLQYLSWLAHIKLGATHPIAVICHELQRDDHDRGVSERALKCMLQALRTRASQEEIAVDVEELTFRTERAIITLLRRDSAWYAAAEKAKALLKRCERQLLGAFWNFSRTPSAQSSVALRRCRIAATELAHVQMDRPGDHYDESIELSLFALTGKMSFSTGAATADAIVWPPVPDTVTGIIRDEKTVYTLEDLAKIYEELGAYEQAAQWLVQARDLAEELLGCASDSSATAHIVQKLEKLCGASAQSH